MNRGRRRQINLNILTQPEYFMEHPIGFESSKISEPESDSEDFVPVCKPRPYTGIPQHQSYEFVV